MTWRIAVLALLLAGCAERVAPEAEAPAEPVYTECFPPPQTIDAWAGGYAYWVPGGGGGGGNNIDLVWSGRSEDLLRFTVRGEWEALTPLAENLRMEAWLYSEYFADQQPSMQGPSPLEKTIPLRDREMRENPILTLGPPQNVVLPVFASATVVDQPIRITIQEVYRCQEDLHP